MKPSLGAGVLAGLLLFFAWIGYFGGDPFTFVPATTKPVPARAHVVAIVLSGDMGFKIGMGHLVARRLAADGIPVIGVNSLTAFRKRRRPADATALVANAIGRAGRVDPAARIILVGQSYGADMLQVGLAGLKADLRAKIAFVALVVPGATVEFRASPGEVFTFLMHEDDALPTARTLDWVPALCIDGAAEDNSLCPRLHQANLEVATLPGGHPLHRDDEAVHAVLIKAIDAALARASPALPAPALPTNTAMD